MKRRLILTLSLSALLTGHGQAMTEAQLSAHLAGQFGAVGARVVPCLVGSDVAGYVFLCGETARRPADVALAWTAAARAPAQPFPFQATPPWDAGDDPDRATFQASDGTRYLARLSAYAGTTRIQVVHSSPPTPPGQPAQSAPPRASTPPASAPERPTRTGPLLLDVQTLDDTGLVGPVRSVIKRATDPMTGTLVATYLRRYDDQGRVTLILHTDAAGAVTFEQTFIFSGARLDRVTTLDEGEATTARYAYDDQGNLSSKTVTGAQGQLVTLTRYVARPGGFTARTTGPDDKVTEAYTADQDAHGQVVRQDSESGPSHTVRAVYDGRRLVSMIDGSPALTIKLTLQRGRPVRVEFSGSNAAGLLTAVVSYGPGDAQGNPLSASEGEDSGPERGVTEQQRVTFTYEYR